MSSTRSPFPPAPATDLLIVSHGSPSDPAPQEAFVQDLAARVAAQTGRRVRGATLAADGALEAAVAGLRAPLVFPHFMADGWFVSTNLQKRLARAGLAGWTTLAPLGLLGGLPSLALQRLMAELRARGWAPGAARLIVAAHGSPSDPRPARATEAFAAALRSGGLCSAVDVGYVDEAPAIADAARGRGPGLVLPFFAARAGHVLMDLPDALADAGFDGPVLPPIGTWDSVPTLIARSTRARQAA